MKRRVPGLGIAGLLALAALAGAAPAPGGEETGSGAPALHPVPVTLTTARRRDLEVWEYAVGQLEARTAPTIAAEVGGRITAVHYAVGESVEAGRVLAEIDPEDYRLARDLAAADIRRLEALLRVQRLQVDRLRALVRRGSANQSDLDEAEARLGALRAQRLAARVRLQQAERNLARTRIRSPVTGRVDARFVSVGDYVKAGTPLFHLTALGRLRARLPYPESLGDRLRVGLPVRLETPGAPGRVVTGRITGIRSVIDPANRAIEVLVDFDNPGDWQPGASVTGAVRLALHRGAVVVPEVCVVARPGGSVVYVVRDGRAVARKVRTGLRRAGEVEILSGVQAGESVVADGAGFLTAGAPVEVETP
ncbi:MAG: efflux RND transporter periplasmic adaptor subunit [Gammaproteobacteria bacterium]|nr:MAG: efflux RND transporter periplasmic adaptor subunit [Gammaproteobacteria bacterium]